MFKALKYIFIIALPLSLIIDLLFTFLAHHGEGHAHYWWHTLPGFEIVYGFIGCALIIIVSKAIGHNWLQKKEDYYD